MEQNTNRKKNFFSEWLETLQQESWQLELLISGLALFGIWQFQSILLNVEYFLDVNLPSEYGFVANIFMGLLWSGWYIFLINLLIHIIIRGFWIGAIGLRYVSGDVDYDELNYSERFTNYFKRRHGSFDDYIERLEKISSVLFSFTFLLFFILLSFVMYLLVYALFFSLIERVFPSSNQGPSGVQLIFILLYYGMGFLVMIDFFSLGAFKKIENRYLSKGFYIVYRFYEVVSLSFIYRPLLLNFIDNKFTKRLFFLSIPYAFFFLLIQGFSLDKFIYFPSFSDDDPYHTENSTQSINWMYYDDLREDHLNSFASQATETKKQKINHVSLDRFENNGKYLKVFLEYREDDNGFLKEEINEVPAFRKFGLRHYFMNNYEVDSNLLRITNQEVHEQEVVRNIVYTKGDIEAADTSLYNTYKNVTPDEMKEVRKDISMKYRSLKSKYQFEKIEKIKQGLLSAYDIKVDYALPFDNMHCEFYMHPNIHERGLLCYMNIDSLSLGLHYLNIRKTSSKKDCISDCLSLNLNLPFRKTR